MTIALILEMIFDKLNLDDQQRMMNASDNSDKKRANQMVGQVG